MSSAGLQRVYSSVTKTFGATRRLKRPRGTRSLHQRKPLPYPIEGGLGDFLPPAALKTVAVDYQEGLLQRLNEEVRGTKEENESVAQTVLNTASEKQRTLAFNYASLALNNSFFLDQLKPPPSTDLKDHQSEISDHLLGSIRTQYGSLVQFKSTFSAAATGMFTNGWVWFVTDRNGNTGVIPTFGPGTLLIRSRSYMTGENKLSSNLKSKIHNPMDEVESLYTRPVSSPTARPLPPGVNPSSPTSGIASKQDPVASNDGHYPRFVHSTSVVESSDLELENKKHIYGDFGVGRYKPQSKSDILNIGEVLHPLFCVSVNEHTWISAGYGVWGKEEWLKQFWTVLDWEKVSQAYQALDKRIY